MTCKPASGQDAIDVISETAVLRHRPDWLLPIAWWQDGESIVFKISDRYSTALRQGVEGMEKEAKTGYRLLAGIMEVVCQTLDHYLIPQAALLTPDLIFFGQGDEADPPIQIACLPLSEGSILEGPGPGLIDFLAKTFYWERESVDHLNSAFAKADYEGLLEEARARGEMETSPPATGSVKEDNRIQGKDKDRPMTPKKQGIYSRLTAFLAGLAGPLWGAGDEGSFHEITEEIGPSPSQVRMAQLSRGLPGTPEEEEGQKAYILTEEFVIGRDIREADLCLDSPAVSRQHARILLKGNRYYLEDLGSRNGSSLDGMALNRHKEYPLPDKCRLAFAGEHFYFRSA